MGEPPGVVIDVAELIAFSSALRASWLAVYMPTLSQAEGGGCAAEAEGASCSPLSSSMSASCSASRSTSSTNPSAYSFAMALRDKGPPPSGQLCLSLLHEAESL